jgi:hypothetical protein
MRLDEWQKFIESQFLEETAVAPAPVKPAVAVQQQTLLPLEDEPIVIADPEAREEALAALPVPEEALEALPVPEVVEAPVAEVQSPNEPVASTPSPPQKTARQTGFVVRSVIETPKEEPPPLPAIRPVPYEPTLDLDPEIPVFADYLPSWSAEPAPVPSEPAVAADLPTADATVGPMSVLLPLTSGFAGGQSSPTPTALPETGAGPADRRRTRAPQARNITTENAATGLSSADLWSQVPRHVQTLLALERREEEREVAQSSYKRPFQEKRAELIARILDPVLSLEDTARLLNVCPTTVRRYTNKGILTHYRKEPERPSANTSERETRQRRFRLSDILTFLETQQSALEADRMQERVAPSRRPRATSPLEPTIQD